MLWTITVVLLVLWALGFSTFHSLGMWVHLLLVLAVISVAINLIRSINHPVTRMLDGSDQRGARHHGADLRSASRSGACVCIN